MMVENLLNDLLGIKLIYLCYNDIAVKAMSKNEELRWIIEVSGRVRGMIW